MNGQSERPVHLSSHIGYFACVGATICHLGGNTKKVSVVMEGAF